MAQKIIILLLIIATLLITGCNTPTQTNDPMEDSYYVDIDSDMCQKNGKPVVALFSTTWCPHCIWIKDTYDEVAKEYADVAEVHHFELDTGDDTLTDEIETEVPAYYLSLMRKYSPQGGVPTFVIGCKYYRIGNGYEGTNNGLEVEKQELKIIIEKLFEEDE